MNLLSRLTPRTLRSRLIAGVVAVHAVLMGLVVLDMVLRQQRFMETQVANDGSGLAEMLSHGAVPWLISNDLNGLGELVHNVKAQHGVSLAMILDGDGRVLASSDSALFNLVLTDAASRRLMAEGQKHGTAQSWHDGLLDSLSAATSAGSRVGFARVILDGAPIQAELNAVVRGGGIYTLVAIASGSVLAWLLVRPMTRRLERLSVTMDQVAAGNLAAELPKSRGRDEVARLTRDFGTMMAALTAEKETQTRLLERLNAANAELTRLTEVAAHHLQEPVRRLVIYAQWLRKQAKGGDTSQVEATLDQIEQDGRSLHALFRDIQLYLSAGHQPDAVAEVDADAAFAAAREELAGEIAASGASLSIRPLPRCRFTEAGLTSVFTILLSNAVKFHREGVAPAITVGGSVDGDGVIYRIVDDGIGVPRDDRTRAFEVFCRLHGREVSGTGIGLAIAKRLVEGGRGRVWLEEAPAGGTIAAVRLPACEAGTAPPYPRLAAASTANVAAMRARASSHEPSGD